MTIANAYIDDFNAGNVDSVFSRFSQDITIDWFSRTPRAEFELIAAFFMGQGTILTSPECTVTREVPNESVSVFCEFGSHTAAGQAIGAPVVPTKLTVVVTQTGIDRLTYTFDEELDFHPIEDPFERWVAENYPDDPGFGWWTTIGEATQDGQQSAEHASEWANYLENNGCTVVLDPSLIPSIAC